MLSFKIVRLLLILFSTALAGLPVSAIAQVNPPTPPLTAEQSADLAKANQMKERAEQLYRQGKYADAIFFAEKALSIQKHILGKNHLDVATSLNNLAALYRSQGDYKLAELLHKEELKIRKHILGENHPDVATCFTCLGLSYDKQGRYQEAESLYKHALSLLKLNGLGESHLEVAAVLNNMAALYFAQGRYSEAESLYDQALKVFKNQLGESHLDVATILNNIAALYFHQGRYSEAETLYEKVLALRKVLLSNDHPDIATSLNHLASLYHKQRRYPKAESFYKQALAIRKRALGENHPAVAISLNNIAGLYANQNRYEEAELLFKQSLQLRRSLLKDDHPDIAQSLNNLGSLYADQGYNSRAKPLYTEALALNKRILGEKHPDVSTNLNNLSLLYLRQKDALRALEFLGDGLQIEEHNLNINLAVGSETQKHAYLATLAGTTHGAVSLHLQFTANNPKAARLAFTTILRRKGRILDTLTDSLQRLRQNLTPADQTLLDDLNANKAQLAHLYHGLGKLPPEQYRARIGTLEERITQLEADLSRRSNEFRIATQPITLTTVQAQIPADAALVELVKYQPFQPQAKPDQRYGKPHYAAYILFASGNLQWVDLGESATIDRALGDLRQALQDPNTPLAQLKTSARRLDALLMQPIRQWLGTTRHLLLSPDGNLNLLPFEALVDEENRYLLETYTFTYLTSGRDLLRLQAAKPNPNPAIVMGDPFFDKPGTLYLAQPTRNLNLSQHAFPPLTGTKAEAEAIAPLLGIQPLLGTQATETAVKQAPSPRILHIATHGFFPTSGTPANGNPLLDSGLVFAGFRLGKSGSDDGVMTALEVSSLNLTHTKLVVLSACGTGLGNVTRGEGIYGLRRAFAIAGAESQVTSLWKVADNATKELMVNYYQRLQAKQGRSFALHQAQLDLLRSPHYSHPYYWAAFIPSGNWRAID